MGCLITKYGGKKEFHTTFVSIFVSLYSMSLINDHIKQAEEVKLCFKVPTHSVNIYIMRSTCSTMNTRV